FCPASSPDGDRPKGNGGKAARIAAGSYRWVAWRWVLNEGVLSGVVGTGHTVSSPVAPRDSMPAAVHAVGSRARWCSHHRVELYCSATATSGVETARSDPCVRPRNLRAGGLDDGQIP